MSKVQGRRKSWIHRIRSRLSFTTFCKSFYIAPIIKLVIYNFRLELHVLLVRSRTASQNKLTLHAMGLKSPSPICRPQQVLKTKLRSIGSIFSSRSHVRWKVEIQVNQVNLLLKNSVDGLNHNLATKWIHFCQFRVWSSLSIRISAAYNIFRPGSNTRYAGRNSTYYSAWDCQICLAHCQYTLVRWWPSKICHSLTVHRPWWIDCPTPSSRLHHSVSKRSDRKALQNTYADYGLPRPRTCYRRGIYIDKGSWESWGFAVGPWDWWYG